MYPVPLACPRDHSRLENESSTSLVCSRGHRYPVIDGVPVLLRDDVELTVPHVRASIARARNEPGSTDVRNPDLYLESLSNSEEEKNLALELARSGTGRIDPIVSISIATTSGNAYKHLIGNLETYPIPHLRLPPGNGQTLIDIGCNWGRWSVAAAQKGYRVIGLDPSLGAVMAARRVARQMGVDSQYIVADGRYLPFEDRSLETVYSYGVLHHFSKPDATRTIAEMGRVLKPNGKCLIQMAHAIGIRSLYQQIRLGREPRGFEVRYWTIPELKRAFREHVGRPRFEVNCYFGLGLEPSDVALMSRRMAFIVSLSEGLRAASARLPFLRYVADSLYISADKVATDSKTS